MAFGPQNRSAVYTRGRTVDQEAIDVGLRQYMLRVYNYMATGLVISGLVAWLVANVPAVTAIFYTMQGGQPVGLNMLGMVAMWAPLVMLLGAAFVMKRPTASSAQMFYWAFVTINGVGLSILLLVYTGESVVRTFFITAAAFAGLSLWGYTTKRNLSGFGNFLVMGLIGLLIAAVVNIFLASSMLQFVISAAGVLIFAGLVAYYTQEIKQSYAESATHDEQTVTAVFGALSLYIAFINLFQFLLYFLGQRE